MKQLLNYIFYILIALTSIYSCKPSDYWYGDYAKNGEIYYPGRVDSLSILPGNKRGTIRLRVSTDPQTSSLKVYLRSSLSSEQKVSSHPIESNEHGKFKLISLNDLNEATYSASIYSFTDKGDSSRAVTASQFIYGDSYTNTLVNRTASKIDKTDPKQIYLIFDKESNLPRQGTFYPMQYTEVSYIKSSGDSNTVQLTPWDISVQMPDIKSSSEISYRTAYKPVQNSLDLFYTDYKTIQFK
jgi:hypothetical protein